MKNIKKYNDFISEDSDWTDEDFEKFTKAHQFEDVNENPKVAIGDTINLINDNQAPGTDEEEIPSTPKVQKVYPDGTILTDDRGHGVTAEFSTGYNAWLIIDDNEEGDNFD